MLLSSPLPSLNQHRLLVANNSSKWPQAIKEEHDALVKNGTWFLVPRASNTNVVDGKWAYRLKQDKNGAITRYKARFIAKGFDNNQLDVRNAFLHGNLKEQVYMKQPPGFIDPQRPNHVCLLHKSLYGLKQAPHAWFKSLFKALFDLSFKGSKTDPSLFIYSRGHAFLYILVYVDDIIVTGNKDNIDNILCQLGSTFALKDLEPLKYFLGIEIVSHVSGILLYQKKYILELLKSASLSNCNLMVISSSFSLDDSTAFLIHSIDLLRPSGRVNGKIRLKMSMRQRVDVNNYQIAPQHGFYYTNAPPPNYGQYPPYNAWPLSSVSPSLATESSHHSYNYRSSSDSYSIYYHGGYYAPPPPPQTQHTKQ
uniref:Retrovirus-related Pol polyprotein from transposon TNT 1-94 n=1 Tax=Tanacetum cinerariifolium TaxID=118510 RepID=A0A699GP76_TANCI|nr:retrovirus-related Pol polyprotein from transposon TNT 1-94 [Tanacetum cinerariifolium]